MAGVQNENRLPWQRFNKFRPSSDHVLSSLTKGQKIKPFDPRSKKMWLPLKYELGLICILFNKRKYCEMHCSLSLIYIEYFFRPPTKNCIKDFFLIFILPHSCLGSYPKLWPSAFDSGTLDFESYNDGASLRDHSLLMRGGGDFGPPTLPKKCPLLVDCQK